MMGWLMSNVPSKEEFEVSLRALSERDQYLSKIVTELESLETDEVSVRAYLIKELTLYIPYREAVDNSPVPKWLLEQHKYQKALTLLLSNDRFKKEPDGYLVFELTINLLRNKYSSTLEDWVQTSAEEYISFILPIRQMMPRYTSRSVKVCLSGNSQWDTKYINSLNNFFYVDLDEYKVQSVSNLFKTELEAVEVLLRHIKLFEKVTILRSFFASSPSSYIKDLNEVKDHISYLKNSMKSDYIKRNDGSRAIREFALALWKWFKDNGGKAVSGQILFDLLEIEGVREHLTDVRRFESYVAEWRSIRNGDT